MTNKSPRSQNGKRPRLKLLDLNFSNNINEVLSNGIRPHGGLRGSKKHPLSPFSFNKDEKHHQHVKESIERQFDDDFIDKYGSPAWVNDANREQTHSGENPLFINRLLSPCRLDNDSCYSGSRAITPTPSGRLTGTPKRANSLYYRQTTPHQYLSATELPIVSATEPAPILGRPTRTTLLRARQRCNSAPVNAYQKRREVNTKESSLGNHSLSREPTATTLSPEGETNHAFLTGARYNRARLMDVKSFNVYGVYMPRENPLDCFMSGPAVNRMKDRNEESPGAPPDTPRSDIDETTKSDEKDFKQLRPSTAPSKRLLSASSPSGGRPRSARLDSSPSVNYFDESENKENIAVNNNVFEKLIYLQNGLFITGRGVVVTLKGFKSPPPLKKESILPSVTGISVPKIKYNKKSRNTPDDGSVINQPPPTPVGQLSIKDEAELLPPLENPKSPIPEVDENKIVSNTKTDHKNEQTDTQVVNTEMSVKITQLTVDKSENSTIKDELANNVHNNGRIADANSLENEKGMHEINVLKHDDNEKCDDNFNEADELTGDTFITDKEDPGEFKNTLCIPNATGEPDTK